MTISARSARATAAAKSGRCPAKSYIDYNLYWYAKSFELAGNGGVYWDNWFVAPSFNTGGTDAYRRADGNVVPTAGIWGLRELSKRTFVMMNELGMRPITFPHMTSFSPLPLLSFATVQYDWEWKYSEGDVQDRYRREYLQLASTGELAGAWPVLLGDQGPLGDDPWTQRTFTAVRIVHELDGGGGFGSTWMKSHRRTPAAGGARAGDARPAGAGGLQVLGRPPFARDGLQRRRADDRLQRARPGSPGGRRELCKARRFGHAERRPEDVGLDASLCGFGRRDGAAFLWKTARSRFP